MADEKGTSLAPYWDVVIVGGSLSGLMYGIALKRQGKSVCILEQATSTRSNTAAGITVGYQGQKYLEQYDLVKTPFWFHAAGFTTLDTNGNVRYTLKRAFNMTSWDALYYRLRANFDGYDSGYCKVPTEAPGVGRNRFSTNKRVLDFDVTSNLVRVRFEDVDNHETGLLETPLLIGADGINSTVRKILAPEVALNYSGFVAWRGTVPELEVSPEAREAFTGLFNCPVPDGGYLVAYAIPGEKGSLEVGSRELNVVWYTEESKDILVDSDGYKHKTTLPKGKMPQQVWEKHLQRTAKMAGPYREVCEKISQPFISTVNDYIAPRISWHDGKVVLVGEASVLIRPNIGASFETAAFALHEFINGNKGWESSVNYNNRRTQTLAKVYGENSLFGIWKLSLWWNAFKLIGLMLTGPIKRFLY